MDTKQQAAGGKPAAASRERDVPNGQAHHTTKLSRVDIDVLLSREIFYCELKIALAGGDIDPGGIQAGVSQQGCHLL